MKKVLPLFLAAAFLPSLSAAEPDAADLAVIHKIRAEAYENSKVMDHVFNLTEVNGPRITNSPGYGSAVEWCLKRLREYGLEAREEEFDFGKGWSSSHVVLQMDEPSYAVLMGFPLAWTPGTDGPVTAEPVLAPIEEKKDFEEYKGKLKGKIVLLDKPRTITLSTKPLGRRYTEKELAERELAPAPEVKKEREGPTREERQQFSKDLYKFLRDEGAAAVLRSSYKGEAGLVAGSRGGSQKPDWPVPPPSAAIMAEQYNRIVRLLEQKIPVKLTLDIKARFHEDDYNVANVIADLPGGSKKDEVVMLGGHLDSWHGGTGAVDNAAGVAIAIEAVRILQAIGVKMDRTVRVGLWAGEEQGLLGSKAYVKEHFGDPKTMKLNAEHSKLSAYYNYDNGSGKIRGIYLQENDMLRPIFEAWLRPLHDLGATAVTIRKTSGTDHLSFDAVGLPGFQFIQDPLEYGPRNHHSNADQYDHVVPGDLIQASIVMATFVYHTAVRPDMLPRKPLPKPEDTEQKSKNDS